MHPDEIRAALGVASGRFDIEVLDECASTNSELMARAQAGAASGAVVVARRQTDGRGRQGRRWFAAPDDSLTFSLLWRFAHPAQLSGLSLAVGVAVVRALQGMYRDAGALALKWPNDIMYAGGKLGGVLIELVPAAGGQTAAIIGVGINVRLPADLPADIRASAAALPDGVGVPNLLATLLNELHNVCGAFAHAGFAPFQAAWCGLDAHRDQPVVLIGADGMTRHGVARGVDDQGALRIESDGVIERVISGEISLRPAVAAGA